MSVTIGCGPTSTRNSPNVPGGGRQHQRLVLRARLPVDQVVGPGVVDRALAEVHQPAAVDLPVEDRAGLAPRGRHVVRVGLEGVEVGEQRPVLLPGEQVRRGGQAQLGVGAVVRRVGEVVGAVDLGDPRVLAAVALVVLGRREHRLRVPLEVDAVVAGREPDVADDVVGVRAVEQHHLAVLHDGGRVVDAARTPSRRPGAQDRVLGVRRERAERELGVGDMVCSSSWGKGSGRLVIGWWGRRGRAGSAADEREAAGEGP